MHFDDAGTVIDIEAAFPSFPAIDCFEDTSFFVVAIEATKSADVDDIRVGWMDNDFTDLEGLLQAHVGPSFPAVCGFVDPISVADRVTRVVFTGAYPEDVRIAGADCDCADRNCCLAVELMDEGVTVVGGFDQATGSGSGPPSVWITFVDGEVDDTSSHVRRTDTSPTNAFGPFLGN